MAKLSLTEVSKRFKVSRSTVYRAIKEGKLSRSADNQFDLAEVIRCFGEPVIKASPEEQSKAPVKDDADLRQLVDFMKREIESYKEREQRYLDQIDRFQLLLGHKESSEKVSHDTSLTRLNGAPQDTFETSHDTLKKQPKKRGLFGRVISAVFNDD
ncbi:plasmid replication DNA-binding protein [Acinetobacter baumannii]|nr:helix-turn-helix domain-containing protein [Acinetobacter baumannii]